MKFLRSMQLALCATRTAVFWLTICLVAGLSLQGCKRKAVPRTVQGESSEINAAWYEVPLTSLAKRRAGLSELTAAHNKLPLGTLVRVTHLGNGKSVNVRITDRGIHDRQVKLDLCKEAAVELGMVNQGIAKVRMEIFSDDAESASSDSSRAASTH